MNLGSDRLVSINGLVDLVEVNAGVKWKRTYNLPAPTGGRGRARAPQGDAPKL